MSARTLASVGVTLALACGLPLPEPHPRFVSAAPSGTVPADSVRVELTASEPLAPEGIVDGRRFALCVAGDLAAVKKLVGSSRVDLQACKLEYSIVSPK